ncbi:MAG: hypothetical protein LBB58_00870, partial [Cellulomonadaceae bacterium]|nr:hypothetical protein [Cellulomonadaceae bacterium]
MLVNTRHIVLFEDAAEDLGRIADMVDSDGAVLMLKDGKPAYVIVAFEDVEEGDPYPAPSAATEGGCGGGGAHGQGGCCKDRKEPAAEKPAGQCQHPGEGPHVCTCGRNPGGMCGGHDSHGHGGHGHGHGHGGHGHGGHTHHGPGEAFGGGFGGFGDFGFPGIQVENPETEFEAAREFLRGPFGGNPGAAWEHGQP